MLEYLREAGLEGLGRYYSTYRGYVVNDEDPEGLNRVLINVPGISLTDVWAFPKGQQGGLGSGFKFLTPNKGDIVFVEFESGDPQYAIYSYCGWAKTETPKELTDNKTLGLVTPQGNLITIDDNTNTFTYKMVVSEDTFHEITITPKGVVIKTPKPITVTSEENIKVDSKGALDVTSEATIKVKAKEKMNLDGETIILNQGGIGTTMTDKLLQKLNALERDVNNLKSSLSAAIGVAVPMDGGKAAFTSLIGYTSTPLQITTMPDIEHKTVKQ